MTRMHTEDAFENAIVESMLDNGWQLGQADAYQPELGLDTDQLLTFLAASQPEAWHRLLAFADDDQERAQRDLCRLIAREIDNRGALDVLRYGAKDRGVRLHLAYFRPAHTVAEDALDDYRHNRLSVTRQLRYAAEHDNTLDLVLFVNGIPVATAELKNPLTGQTVENAKHQYRTARNPQDLLFAKRSLVHFAVDPDLVFLTTRLAGNDTQFLPFNQGTGGPGAIGGAGNPAAGESGYASAYLWRQIWHRDTWLDLLKRFLHLEDPDKDRRGRGRPSPHDRKLIFPRYHQWHAVRNLTDHAARHGSGTNYLVMHSAGSGKSNTIGWLAHRLSTLHGSEEPGALDADAARAGRIVANEPVFHKIVVITDRDVLDKQLQDTIYQFDHTPGVVERITGSGGSKSHEVAQALSNTASKIIIVTVQTFPYVLEGVSTLHDKRVAILVDEAHSGQSGESVTKLKKVLRGMGAEETGDDDVDPLTSSAMARGRHTNLSYFAFTATPKDKTLQLFGTPEPDTGQNRPFHTYSMRQAIEEGFILDVLPNYVTYQTYWRVAKEGAEDIEVNPDRAGAEIARFAYLNPATLAQHAEIIVRHFRDHAAHRLGGRSKAMVVTRSRESAVRMYRAIQQSASDLGWPDLGVLVAFSGSLTLDGEEVTESQLNDGLPEKQLVDAFNYTAADQPAGTRQRQEYRILVVADKYQTGFDQPLLTTMYVEKPLAGVAAVQTLSRLNRIHPRKAQDDLFVLDFANDADHIQQAFKPYYEEAVTTPADPNLLYDLERTVMDHQLLYESEMQAFVDDYLAKQPDQSSGWKRQHGNLYKHTDTAVRRFEALQAEDTNAAEEFRGDLSNYLRKYGFLAQVMQFTDPELERLFLFGKHLLNRLPRRNNPAMDIGELDLTHLRVSKTGEHDLRLDPEGEHDIGDRDDNAAGGGKDPRTALLAELIEEFNQRYGLGLSDPDKIQLEERYVALAHDDKMVQGTLASRNEGDVEHLANERFREIMIERAEASTELTEKFFNNDELQASLSREARRAAFRMIRRRHGLSESGG